MVKTTDITSFTEFRSNLRDHFNECKSSGRPLFVTTNGETEAVILSPAAYDALARQFEAAQHDASLRRSIRQMEAGEGQSLKDAVREVAKELGLHLDR